MRVKGSSTGEPPAFDPRRVRFVLVEPRFAGNVGAAARAMKNLGFRRLILVQPGCDPHDREARMMAVEAGEILDGAEIHDDLDAALAGAHTVVGTSRRTGKHRQPHWRLDQLAPELVALAARGELAIVLGREDHGLTDEELDRCTHLVHFSASDDYPSFNLAQSVLLVAYELRLAGLEPPEARVTDGPADHESREGMYRHLGQAFLAIGFLTRDSAEPIMRRLRRMLGRAEMNAEEVRLLRGVARQTLWLAARAGLPVPTEKEQEQPEVSHGQASSAE